MRRHLFALGLVVSAASSVGRSADLEELSLTQALELAAAHTQTLEIAHLQELQAQHRTTVARAGFFPTLSVQGNYQQQDPNGASSRINAVFGAPQYYGRVNLTQNLFAGTKDWFGLKSAELASQAAQDGVNNSELTIYRETAALYYGVLAAELDLQHLRDVFKAGSDRAQDLKSRVSLGRSRKADWLAALAQVSSLEADVQGSEQALRTQRGQLSLRLQVPATIRLVGPGAELPEIQGIDAYYARVEMRPDVLAQIKSLEMAQSNVWIARSGHMPTLSAFGNVYFVRGGTQAGNLWDAGAQLEFPLFQGGAISGAVREAAEKVKEMELTLDRVRRLAREEIMSAWEATQGTRVQTIALKKAVQDAQASYSEQEKNYRFGQAQNLDVIQALNAWATSRRSYDRLRFQSWVAYTTLQGAAALLRKGAP